MARKDRTGNRKAREQRQPLKIPELGYYLVVTDTQATERFYFQGMHKELPKAIQNKLVIKVVETKTKAMVGKCLEMTAYDAQYRMPWIVFDRDEVKGFDEIIEEAQKAGINVGWSNPCFEIWMHSYYGAMPAIMESWVCCNEFAKIFERKTSQKYSKSDAGLYEKIFRTGDEEKAFQIAGQKYKQCIREGKTRPSQMCPCTTVYQLVEEIRKKVNFANE